MTEKSKWKKCEDNLILKHYKYNYEHLVVLLKNRTAAAITIRAGRLGVSKRVWSVDEDEFIRQCYPDYGSVYCMRYVKARTIIAIQSRAKKLGVKRKLDKRKNGLPNGNVLEVEKMMYNKPWGGSDD